MPNFEVSGRNPSVCPFKYKLLNSAFNCRKYCAVVSVRTKPQCMIIQMEVLQHCLLLWGSIPNYEVCERNPSVWPFKWMLMSSFFLSVTSFYGNNERVLFFFSKNAHANATFRYLKENYQPDITKRVVCERNTILCDHSNGSYWLQCCFAFDDCTKRYFWSVLRLGVQPFKTFHSFRVNQRKPKALRTYKECQAQLLISTSFSDIWHVISSVTSGYIHK